MLKLPRFLKHVIVIALFASAISYIYARRNSFSTPATAITGKLFDYDPNETWIGPGVGERIEIGRLKDASGKRLEDVVDDMSMLVLVDPACAAGKAVSEELTLVRESVNKFGIKTYFVCVTSLTSATNLSEYTESLAPQVPAYAWSDREVLPPEKLYLMVVPSHILIDKAGVIIRKWPGTSRDESVRRSMAEQITADTLAEVTSRRSSRKQP